MFKNAYNWTLLALILAAGSAWGEQLNAAGGARLAVTEVSETGSHSVTPGLSMTPVDARSRIVLAFSATGFGRSDNENRWKSLRAILQEISGLTDVPRKN